MSVCNLPILVVEDSDEDFDTLQVALRATALENEICRVTNGDECLARLRSGSYTAFHRPALVMMDLNTPGTDGRGALESIKADPALRDLPVVVLSTSANLKDLEFCYRVGANAYHVKPVRYGDHLQLMKNVFTYWLGSVFLPYGDRSLS